ncbi:DUF2182 domain-containing protein [Massilia aurea]|uniref:DUF2182 domain-containing protein n=1 Tax=Massilia aurea TaxID=373040 RepID=UPI0034622415
MNLSDLEASAAPERPLEMNAGAHSDRPVALSLLLVSLLASLFWAGLVLGGLVLRGAAPLPATASTVIAAGPSLAWHAGQLALVFLTWAGLCTALMLPLASRAAVLFARLAGHRAARRARLRTGLFVLGYLGAWTGFALLAAIAQWTLHAAGPGGAIRHPLLLGLVLVAAGVYQWTPAKHACLAHCRAPLTGILAGWRDGLAGALRHGAAHAHEALGCCWLLMLVLLAAGPDNPVAIIVVGLFVLAEIRLTGGHQVACAGGLALLALGTGLLFP